MYTYISICIICIVLLFLNTIGSFSVFEMHVGIVLLLYFINTELQKTICKVVVIVFF